MQHEMRRKRQQLSEAETLEILQRHTAGVLSLIDAEGYPYGVPLSHAYADGKLYFHSALRGHKIEAIQSHARASFTVIDQDKVVPEEFTTYFRSVIAFGSVRILEDDAEKRHAINILAARFAPDNPEGNAAEIERLYKAFLMIEFRIEHLTGKEARELMEARKKA